MSCKDYSSFPCFSVSCFEKVNIVFRYGDEQLFSRQCNNGWTIFEKQLRYKSSTQIDGCYDMCMMTSAKLERMLNSIIKYIGKSFDYSVLNKSNNLVLLFCKLPDFVGEISCDDSIVAILSRQKTFLDKCFAFNMQESNSVEQKYLNNMRLLLQKWVNTKKITCTDSGKKKNKTGLNDKDQTWLGIKEKLGKEK